MANCPRCGAEVPGGVRFCTKCGAAVPTDTAAQSSGQRQLGAAVDLGKRTQSAGPASARQGEAHSHSQQTYMPNHDPGEQANFRQSNYQQSAQRDLPSGIAPADVEANRLLSVFAYLFSLVGIILVLVAKPDSAYCRFHANQALCLQLFEFVCALLFIIPILGWIVGGIGLFFGFICNIIGIVRALQGTVKELPLIGNRRIL